MNKVTFIKIAGFLVVPILLMLVVMYLLYPMINKDRYDLIVETNGTMIDSVMMDSLARLDSLAMVDSLYAFQQDSLMELENEIQQQQDAEWINLVDSLQRVIYVLNARIEGLENEEIVEGETSAEKLAEEAFKDRVKSLLKLEEDELAPILDKMSKDQLVRLYSEAGNTQREKILRSLNSDRAARLITEIML